MKKIITTLVLLMASSGAFAAPTWMVYEVAVSPANQATVAAATQKFMASKTGKAMPGSLHLNGIIANGASPATHSFALLFPSMASLMNWQASMAGNADFAAFMGSLTPVSQPVSEYINSFGANWGTASNDDRLWQLTRFRTTDPMAVVAAQNKLMSDPSMKDFPGQIGLSATGVGNRSGMNNDSSSHIFSVGFESVEEMESWGSYLQTQPAWGEYLRSLQGVVEWQGTELLRNLMVFDSSLDLEAFVD